MGHGLIKDDQTMGDGGEKISQSNGENSEHTKMRLKRAQDILVDKIANDVELRAMVAKNYHEKRPHRIQSGQGVQTKFQVRYVQRI